jgi:drug/metabolite transporter (DMT)-like permease
MFEQLLLLSEVILSAYPLLIKLVDASVTFQVGLRMLTYTSLAILISHLTNTPFSLSSLVSKEGLAVGALNLTHVAASYIGFDQLTAGNAMALFYTYPVFNLLGASLAFGEKIPFDSIPWILVAFVGAILLAQPTSTNWTAIGVVAALLAALTETGIYLWFRQKGKEHDERQVSTFGEEKDKQEPWTHMAQMYGSSGLQWLILVSLALFLGVLSTKIFQVSGKGLLSILGFNSLIGFVGYALRFYIIPKVSTITFSSLSFFGIVSAYLFGWFFTGETANMSQIAGAAAIIVANSVLLKKEIV